MATLTVIYLGYSKYQNAVFSKGNIVLGIVDIIVTLTAFCVILIEPEFVGMAVGISIVKNIRLMANMMNKSVKMTKLSKFKKYKRSKTL